MGILGRFSDIISANINELLDKLEDPSKMIDKYLRDAMEDLAEVKKETAAVMAEETKAKRNLDEISAEVEKYFNLAKAAIEKGEDNDARVFLEKKQSLEKSLESAKVAYEAAKLNAEKMRQLHDKLTNDINSLKTRRDAVKAKVSVAKTQETINKIGASADKLKGSMGAFERMEEKADAMLDRANAEAELNKGSDNSAEKLAEKYSQGNIAVEDELKKLKESMGL